MQKPMSVEEVAGRYAEALFARAFRLAGFTITKDLDDEGDWIYSVPPASMADHFCVDFWINFSKGDLPAPIPVQLSVASDGDKQTSKIEKCESFRVVPYFTKLYILEDAATYKEGAMALVSDVLHVCRQHKERRLLKPAEFPEDTVRLLLNRRFSPKSIVDMIANMTDPLRIFGRTDAMRRRLELLELLGFAWPRDESLIVKFPFLLLKRGIPDTIAWFIEKRLRLSFGLMPLALRMERDRLENRYQNLARLKTQITTEKIVITGRYRYVLNKFAPKQFREFREYKNAV